MNKLPSTAPNGRVLLAFGLSTLLGGANAVAVRFTVAELPPFWGAALRFTAATLIFVLIAVMSKRSMPPRSDLIAYIWYGVIGFGMAYALLYWGLQVIPAGMAQVILALTPLLTLFAAMLHRLESFRWRGLIGAILCAAGIGLAFFEGGDSQIGFLPLLAIIGGAACFAESSVILKAARSQDPVMSNAVAMFVGALMLLGFSALAGESWTLPVQPSTWLSVLYLVIVGSVIVFYLVVYVLGHWTASASSYILVIMPFVTVLLGALIADESIGRGLLFGGALVLLGVWIGALTGNARAAAR
jgi:drug/metabolite transporter (DMT)-like permease